MWLRISIDLVKFVIKILKWKKNDRHTHVCMTRAVTLHCYYWLAYHVYRGWATVPGHPHIHEVLLGRVHHATHHALQMQWKGKVVVAWKLNWQCIYAHTFIYYLITFDWMKSPYSLINNAYARSGGGMKLSGNCQNY